MPREDALQVLRELEDEAQAQVEYDLRLEGWSEEDARRAAKRASRYLAEALELHWDDLLGELVELATSGALAGERD